MRICVFSIKKNKDFTKGEKMEIDWEKVIDNFISMMDMSMPYDYQIMNAEQMAFREGWPLWVKEEVIGEIYVVYIDLKLNARYI